MTERTWLIRDLSRRVLVDWPPAPATWPSVARRLSVILFFFALGIVLGDFSLTVLGCFGALQMGLVEAALPFGKMASLQVRMGIACIVSVGLMMWIGGTWWAVAALALLAYVFGCTASLSPRVFAIGVSALALGVIFSGNPRPLDEIPISLGWLALGVLVQALGALVMWRPERMWFARRALANKMRADVALLHRPSVEPTALIRAHTQGDVVVEVLQSAEFAEADDRRLRGTFSAVVLATRAIVAWMVLEQPGEEDRMRVGIRVATEAAALEGKRTSRRTASELSEEPDTSLDGVDRALDGVDRCVATINGGAVAIDNTLVARAQNTSRLPSPGLTDVTRALTPGSHQSRHGLRMAVGIGAAEALTLALPGNHSFWLPLTVVFVLRPDWSFTIVRGLNRLVGNLAAVLLLPALITILGGSTWGLFALVAVVGTVLYRWFFGHYAIASFGLAGTVLLLDYALQPNDSLFAERVADTLLGALLSVAVVLLIPGWSRVTAPAQVDSLVGIITQWRSEVRARLNSASQQGDDALEEILFKARHALMQLETTVTGVLLEPNGRGRPVELAMVLSAGARECSALMAATYGALSGPGGIGELSHEERMTLVDRARIDVLSADLDLAVNRYRAAGTVS